MSSLKYAHNTAVFRGKAPTSRCSGQHYHKPGTLHSVATLPSHAPVYLQGPSSDNGADKREMLVAQLVQEEVSARAALEALKRVRYRQHGESTILL